MSEMTARERMLIELWAYKEAGDDHYATEYIERIIAIVREAMLSEDAAVAFTGSAEGVMVDGYRRDMSDALDAAFGPGKEGGSEGRPSERVEDVRDKYNRGEIQTADEIVQTVMDAHDPDVISELLEYNRTRGTKQ